VLRICWREQLLSIVIVWGRERMRAGNDFLAQSQQLFCWHILEPLEFVKSFAFNILQVYDFLKNELRLKTFCNQF